MGGAVVIRGRTKVPTVIADGPRGAVETPITDLDDAALASLASTGQPDAIREYWARQKRPGWLNAASARIGRQRGTR
jgi:hypothetical protein